MLGYKPITVQPRQEEEALPYKLLQDADPDRTKVDQYCREHPVFLAKQDGATIGVYVLQMDRTSLEAEVLNIAIDDKYRGKGIGKLLIQHACTTAKTEGMQLIRVGTGNSSIGQIAFYQKCGFDLSAIKKNFFVENYSDPIVENGIPCKHMIVFEKKL